MNAVLRPSKPGTWAWSLKLGGRLPRGRYTLLVRAQDRLGNVSKTFAGKPRLRVGR